MKSERVKQKNIEQVEASKQVEVAKPKKREQASERALMRKRVTKWVEFNAVKRDIDKKMKMASEREINGRRLWFYLRAECGDSVKIIIIIMFGLRRKSQKGVVCEVGSLFSLFCDSVSSAPL